MSKLGAIPIRWLAVVVAVQASWFSLSHGQSLTLSGQVWISLAEGPRVNQATYRLVESNGTSVRLLIADNLIAAVGGWRALDQRMVTATGAVTAVVDPGGQSVSRTMDVQALQPVGPQPAHVAPNVAPPVSGNLKWVVVGCRYSDDPSTPTAPADWAAFLGSTNPGLDHFWQENSYGAVNLAGSAPADWYGLPQPAAFYNPGNQYDDVRLQTDCLAAADAAVNFAQFDGIILQFNGYIRVGSGFASFARLNPVSLTLDGQTRTYRLMFMSKGHDRDLSVWAHEMGHTFGFYHSGGSFNGVTLGGFPYNSGWDVMSGGQVDGSLPVTYVPVHTLAYKKEQAGWLTVGQVVSAVAGMQTVRLERGALPQSGLNPRLIKIPMPTAPGMFYTVEARQQAGYDQPDLPLGLPGNGVVLHRVGPDPILFPLLPGGPDAIVVDADGNGNVNDAGAIWSPGETFTDPQNGITVSVAAAAGTSTAYDVTVTVGPVQVTQLQNFVPVSGVGGGPNSWFMYTIDVPAGRPSLKVETSLGVGDADLYVRPATYPTLTAYQCRSLASGNNETCVITNPSAGTWYVGVRGWSAFSGLSVQATHTAPILAILTPPGGAVSGLPFGTPPVVQLQDPSGAPLAQAGVSVAVALGSGTGTLIGTTSVLTSAPPVTSTSSGAKVEPSAAFTVTTTANGQATFSDLGVVGASAHSLSFSSLGFTPVTSPQFAVAAQAPTTLQSGAPVGPIAGTRGSERYYQIVVPAGATNLKVEISGGTPDADLYLRSGQLPSVSSYDCRPFSTGNVELCNVASPAGGTYYVMVRGFSPYTGVSLVATVSSNSTGSLAVQTQPSGASSGVNFTQQPTVQLLDGNGQPLAQAGVVVTAAIASGSGALSGTLTASTNGSGLATFTSLRITGAGSHTLRFTAAGFTSATSQGFVVVTTQNNLTVQTQPGGAISGQVFTQQPTIQLRMPNGQPLAQSGVVVTASIGSGTGALSGPITASTNGTGLAAFAGLRITGSGNHALRFAAPSMVGATSNPFPVAAAADFLAIVTQPGGGLSGQNIAPQPIVQLMAGDGQPRPQAGVQVSVVISAGGGTLGGATTVVTDAAGRANFADLRVTGPGTKTLAFTASGFQGATSSPFEIVAGVSLAVEAPGDGAGTVTGGGLACTGSGGVTTGICVTTVAAGAAVTLQVAPASGSLFTGWSGVICPQTSDCPLLITAPTVVRASFSAQAGMVTRSVDELLGSPGLAAAERLYLDRTGNQNGTLDLGDLVALLDRTGTTLAPELMTRLLAIPQSGGGIPQ